MAMTLRADKGAILSWSETDANFKACMGAHNLLHVQDRKPTGTNGGTFTSGAWRTRDLNTVLVNNITGASLNYNQIILMAGSYYIDANFPAFNVSAHVVRLYNITDSDVIVYGTNAYSYGAYTDNFSSISFFFDLVKTTTLSPQHVCSVTGYFGGFSTNIGQGYNVISDLKIWKIG